MTEIIISGVDKEVTVIGDHVASVPVPGLECPTCLERMPWIQAVMGEHTVTAFVLITCGHEFSTLEWELFIRYPAPGDDVGIWTLERTE